MPKESRLTPESLGLLTDDVVDAADTRFLLFLTVTVLGI